MPNGLCTSFHCRWPTVRLGFGREAATPLSVLLTQTYIHPDCSQFKNRSRLYEMTRSSIAVNVLILRAAVAFVATSHITAAQTPSPSPLCSCSPTEFSFQLNFQGSCESTSLSGVSDELCFVNARSSGGLDIDNILGSISDIQVPRSKNDYWRRLTHTDNKQHVQRGLNSEIPTTITSVGIYEYDTSNDLQVINQQVFSDQSLVDGDIIQFTSISSQLDPSIPLHDQLQYFPGGLILKYAGVNSNDEYISNTIAWGYNIEDCTTEQISAGEYVGWTTIEDVTPANGAFCPATVTPQPTLSPQMIVAPTSSPTRSAVSNDEEDYILYSNDEEESYPSASSKAGKHKHKSGKW